MSCGRGNLSPAQLALIVDQYLYSNQFFQTHLSFRSEASFPYANSPANANLLSLEDIMGEYIFLKNQKALMDKERFIVMQERNRIQMFMQNMQNAMEIYTNSRNPTYPGASISTVLSTQNIPAPLDLVDAVNFSPPMTRVFDKKRKNTQAIDGSIVAKRPRGRPPGKKNQVKGPMLLPSPNNKVDFGSSSTTTKPLMENCVLKGSHISANPVSRTYPTIHLLQSDTHVSPSSEISPVATCNVEAITPCYNVIPIKRVMDDPVEEMVYKQSNSDISCIEADSGQTSKMGDTNNTSKGETDKPSKKPLDASTSQILESLESFLNEIPTLEESDNGGCEEWSKIDFSNFEIEFAEFFKEI